MPRPAPDRAELLACARRLAELHGIEAPEPELRDRIDYVLWGRKDAWAAVEAGLLTPTEVRDLLLAHLDYECADLSGHSWADLDPEARATLEAALDHALFGDFAPDPP
jgi:hypothetical protein